MNIIRSVEKTGRAFGRAIANNVGIRSDAERELRRYAAAERDNLQGDLREARDQLVAARAANKKAAQLEAKIARREVCEFQTVTSNALRAFDAAADEAVAGLGARLEGDLDEAVAEAKEELTRVRSRLVSALVTVDEEARASSVDAAQERLRAVAVAWKAGKGKAKAEPDTAKAEPDTVAQSTAKAKGKRKPQPHGT